MAVKSFIVQALGSISLNIFAVNLISFSYVNKWSSLQERESKFTAKKFYEINPRSKMVMKKYFEFFPDFRWSEIFLNKTPFSVKHTFVR
jgi:hypothetical protein